jgi:hypothetical protein
VLLQLLLPFSSQKVRFFGPKISIVAPILLPGGPLFLSTGSIHIHPLLIQGHLVLIPILFLIPSPFPFDYFLHIPVIAVPILLLDGPLFLSLGLWKLLMVILLINFMSERPLSANLSNT